MPPMPQPLRLPLAALAGAIAMMAWGMVFWLWIYAWVGIYQTPLPESPRIAAFFQETNTTTGTYFYPARDAFETSEEWLSLHRAGPFFELRYVAEGVDPQSPAKMIRGFLHYLLISLLAAGLLRLTSAALPVFWKRALAVFLAGMLGTLFIRLGDPIWFHVPWDYASGVLVYEVIAWLLLACVLAGIMKPAHPARSTPIE
jgi:hypothetical protein